MTAVAVSLMYVAIASVAVTFEKAPGKITYHRCQMLHRRPIRTRAVSAPYFICSRGCANPRHPGSSARSEPKITKGKPPGPANDGRLIAWTGALRQMAP